jgi:hypothetical protein
VPRRKQLGKQPDEAMPSSRGDSRAAERARTGGAKIALRRGQRVFWGVCVVFRGSEFYFNALGPVPEVDVVAKRPQGLLNVGDSFRADGGAAFLRS